MSVAYGGGQVSFKRIRRHLQRLGFALQPQCIRAPDLDSISLYVQPCNSQIYAWN